MIALAHLSDLHLDGSLRNAERADRVMRFLDALPLTLDAVVVTGDIVDTAEAAEYEQARDILTSEHEVVVCPGASDARDLFRTHLLDTTGAGPVNQIVKAGGAVIMMIDSGYGRLASSTLDWLADQLASHTDAPVFVGLHHPPVKVSPHATALESADRLAEIIERHPNVVAVLAGHAEAGAATTFAGRPLLVAPGVARTAPLPWHGFETDHTAEPMITLHVIDDEGNLTTHFRVVPE